MNDGSRLFGEKLSSTIEDNSSIYAYNNSNNYRDAEHVTLYPVVLHKVKGYTEVNTAHPHSALTNYEEYNLQSVSVTSDEEGIPDQAANENVDGSTKEMSKIDLSHLAERVTQDVDSFFKTRSRNNSSASTVLTASTSNCRLKTAHGSAQSLDTISQSSRTTDLSFSSAVDQPLHLRLDRELYIDKIISEKHRLNSDPTAEMFLYRPGITNPQLHYSKELASMYDLVTPKLLYVSAKKTKETLQLYKGKLQVPSVSEVSYLLY